MRRSEWMSSSWHHGDGSLDDAPPRFGMPPAVRLWLPVVVSFLVQVPVAVFLTVRAADGGVSNLPEWHGPGPEWVAATAELPVLLLGLALALIGPLALIAARRFPGPVVAIVAAAASADFLFAPPAGPPYVAFAFATILGIVRGASAWVFSAVAAAWLLCVVGPSVVGSAAAPFPIAALTVGLLLSLGIGAGIRGRREGIRAARQAFERRREDATQQERVRIARELHDVLAHSLSQISVQAGVGLHLIERQPEKAAEALANIKQTSRVALDEVRGVLGMLRDGDSPLLPQPQLSMVHELADTATRAGLAVTLDDSIETPPPAAVQMALYRLVQESVTNAVRHAEASALSIRLAEENGDYIVEITDDGRGATDAEGRGILGMRERAELLGGTLTAGPRDGVRGFRVRGSIPVRGAR
ncbi:sensor histidine kinase [Homoserinimonas aerilata]|nr:sensor histidine kinase [Homoserinimonas aerilata]